MGHDLGYFGGPKCPKIMAFIPQSRVQQKNVCISVYVYIDIHIYNMYSHICAYLWYGPVFWGTLEVQEEGHSWNPTGVTGPEPLPPKVWEAAGRTAALRGNWAADVSQRCTVMASMTTNVMVPWVFPKNRGIFLQSSQWSLGLGASYVRKLPFVVM